jgi:hypothetical protein
MVRQTTRFGASARAAALTPSTPQAFTPSRIELSSGFFDIDAMVTVVERKRPRSGRPELILPIVDRRSPSKSVPSRLSAAEPVRVSRHALESARRSSRADLMALVWFGLAWLGTTASGAVLVGHWMLPAHTPVPDPVAVVCPPPPAPAAAATCHPLWEPPLVAVKDLPEAPAPAPMHARPHTEPHPENLAATARPPAARPDRRAEVATTAPAGRGQRAKAAPAAPKSLEDWIRSAVSSPSKGSF